MSHLSRQISLCVAFALSANIAWASPMLQAEEYIKAGQYLQALDMITPAAKVGNPVAQYLLASLYLNGNGVSQDIDEALKWLSKSAEQGYAKAQSDLGALYLVGRNVARDTKRGADLLLKAAQQGEPGAFYNLGVMYRDGLGTERDTSKAKSHFLTAAEKGYANAQYALARMYYDAGDFLQASRWYEKAGDQGDLEALYNLGYMYHEGQGVARDYGKANALFLLTAKKGRFDKKRRAYKALDMLGNTFRYGEGVQRDYVEAYKWYILAAAQGHTRAAEQMKEVAQFMTESQIAEARKRAKEFAEGKNDGQ